MSEDTLRRHWHKEPADSTHRLAAAAPFTPTEKGLQVATSVITGKPGQRTIVQAGEKSLMFNGIREAKDAVDLILDRLNETAERLGGDA